jgi:hypothetical protein
MLADSSWLSGAVAGSFSAIAVSLTIEYLKRYVFVPRLKLVWEPRGKGFTPIARVPGPFAEDKGPEVNARYVRVTVTNKSFTNISAKSCRAYLTEIHRLNVDGSLTETSFAESLRLRWAYEGPDGELHGGIDIPKNVKVFFDVFSSQEACTWAEKGKYHDPQRILEVAARNAREAPELLRLLDLDSSYRFSIMVTADGVSPKQAKLDVRLGNQWDDIKVLDLTTISPSKLFGWFPKKINRGNIPVSPVASCSRPLNRATTFAS